MNRLYPAEFNVQTRNYLRSSNRLSQQPRVSTVANAGTGISAGGLTDFAYPRTHIGSVGVVRPGILSPTGERTTT